MSREIKLFLLRSQREEKIQQEEEKEWLPLLVADQQPYDSCLEQEITEKIVFQQVAYQALSLINLRWAEVLNRRFSGGETLEETAAYLGVTKTRVQQIEKKAIKKLQENRKLRRLIREAMDK